MQLSDKKPKLTLVQRISPTAFIEWYDVLMLFVLDRRLLPRSTDFEEFVSWQKMYNLGLYTTEAIDVYLGHLPYPDGKVRRWPTIQSWKQEIFRFNELHAIMDKGITLTSVGHASLKTLFGEGYHPSEVIDILTEWLIVDDSEYED